ncbi:unnamed protein product [Rotaria socialis]|uniref:Uncharacterized protein n=1 Tax=Rotaria socialis TaxID=392032 RepID=A0A820WUN5_9BILA|nr:unnamed protein product [Rotaria socialis]
MSLNYTTDAEYDYLFKILIIGDSGVEKTTILQRFAQDYYSTEYVASIGVVYRRIIDEQNDDEKRTWCIVTYPRGVTVYNSIVQTFHFLAPFMINVVSAVILIATKSRRQTAVQTRRTYRELLQAQFQQHQYLFTGPVLLVILGLPRLIMSFVLKCMKSKNDAWYFSIDYFISFLPPMLTFVIFILPSKFYKREFHESLTIYLSRMKRHSQFNT